MTTIKLHDKGVKLCDLDVINYDQIKKQTWKMSFFQQTQSLNLVLKDGKKIKIKEFSIYTPEPYFDFEITKLINTLNKHNIPSTKFSQSPAAELQRLIVFVIVSIIFVEMFFKSRLFRW